MHSALLFSPHQTFGDFFQERSFFKENVQLHFLQSVSDLEQIDNKLHRLFLFDEIKIDQQFLDKFEKFTKLYPLANFIFFSSCELQVALPDYAHWVEVPFYYPKLHDFLERLISQHPIEGEIYDYQFFPSVNQLIHKGDCSKSISFPPLETEMLLFLLNEKRPYTPKELLHTDLFNCHGDLETKRVESHIYSLRKKLSVDQKLSELIVHEDQKGYKINFDENNK